MKYNKVIMAGLLAVAIGFSAGCSTKRVQNEAVSAKVSADTVVECNNFTAPGNNNNENIHRDPIRVPYQECMQLGGYAGFYDYELKERR